ncbi:MAG: DUF4287 domain-containing protein [Candidatus Nanopelagicaceae bacterium]
MATKDSNREAHFPAIEKRYGEKMAYWFKVMAKIKDKKYPEQMAHLQENYGFSRAHANALIMFSKGSKSSRRFESLADYYKSIDPIQAKTIRAIFKVAKTKYPKLEIVIAWNQPMLKLDSTYVLGAGTAKNHILLNPFSKDVIVFLKPKLRDYRVLKHTFAIPNDWTVDSKLVLAMVRARLAEK